MFFGCYLGLVTVLVSNVCQGDDLSIGGGVLVASLGGDGGFLQTTQTKPVSISTSDSTTRKSFPTAIYFTNPFQAVFRFDVETYLPF